MKRKSVQRTLALLAVMVMTSAGWVAGVSSARAQAVVDAPAATVVPTSAAPAVTPEKLWDLARSGDQAAFNAAIARLVEAPDAELGAGLGHESLRSAIRSLHESVEKRESTRLSKIAEVDKKLDEKLAESDAGPKGLSEALKLAVERFVISTDKDGFKAEPRIAGLISRADAAAREAEAKGDWFMANELFWRLHVLLEEEGTYKDDTKRLGSRLSMIRLYAPERFWELRNEERRAAGKSDLPPYNGLGEDFREKLQAIDAGMVKKAIFAASKQHIERKSLRDLMLGGIEAVRTMVTTADLEKTFEGLKNPVAKEAFLSFLDQWSKRLNDPDPTKWVLAMTLSDFVDDLVATNRTTVAMQDQAVLHEFGNGAMGKLDDYSAVIWPDEVARFNRMTEGKFIGVGIQIQMDEETQLIKVVTPLEGSPAMRAGVKAGDLIKKIDGKSAIGISLNQAVDLITGPERTKVDLTVERATGEKDHDGKEFTTDVDFQLTRAVIKQPSVKGWVRTGAKEDDWDWFIDKDRGIGYLRLSQFTEETTTELRNAIAAMKQSPNGLGGLILDLRYNPGGLLTEAVSVSNTFIDNGVIVSTEGNGSMEPPRSAEPGNSMLGKTPLVVLINQGSASASEIVSGAIRHYADKGDINALVIGERSFGKGSVQNVWNLLPAKMKLTTQYYKLPDGRIIHRKPKSQTWGVEPHLTVSMLPEAESEALKLRQEADVLEIDSQGKVVETGKPRPDPRRLVDDGMDVQLETALVILQGKAESARNQAARPVNSTPQ